jgi:predicted negative regulator of RcsB-dependent stress response
MAAQSTVPRSRRPPQSEPDDVVLARALQFAEWAKRNVAMIVGGGVLAVLLLGGLFWYRTDQARRLESAAIEFMQVEQSVQAGDESIAIRDLQQYIERHDGTPYGDEARVMLGSVYLRAEQPAEAAQVLRPVADRLQRSPVGAQAALLLAASQEAQGQRAEAIQTYVRVGDRAQTLFRRQEGLVNAAILHEESGDFTGAAQIWARLVETTEEGSPDRAQFEMRLAEAQAQAGAR